MRRRAGRVAPLAYLLGWLGAGAAMVLVALAVTGGREDEVSLPPVRQTEFTDAARAAGCVLRGRDAKEPPVTGPPAAPAKPRVYSRPPARRALIGALRRGTVIIHHRTSVAQEAREQFERLQEAVPAGTIVTPNAEMPYEVAVAAWERLLACPRLKPGTLDAIRLFRGRFIGAGPDR